MKRFETFAEVRKEYDAVSRELGLGEFRYNDETDTFYAKKGDEEGRKLCKKYKALSRVLNAVYNLDELYENE